jgi:hypothetical protein
LEVNLKGAGSAIFAGVLLLVAGTLNVIYGIRAVDDANFFVNNTQFVFSSLHTWGWVSIILGAIQLTGGVSLFGGGLYGRIIGIVAATIGAVASLLNIGGAHPWWSIGIFAICLVVLHGLLTYGEPEYGERERAEVR